MWKQIALQSSDGTASPQTALPVLRQHYQSSDGTAIPHHIPPDVVVWLLQTVVAVVVATLPLECQVSPACSCHGDDVSAHITLASCHDSVIPTVAH